MKCIIWSRVSTESQEVESQLYETREYAKSLGFNEFVELSGVGASARQQNQKYLELVDRMYQTIETDSDIKAVVVWTLNRLARNDVKAMEIKQFLINHKIQLYIKEPTLCLLNEDGTVNTGMELAFSLFATMGRQQADELKAKSRRAKARNTRMHYYNGGMYVKFGYMVDGRAMIPHPTDAAIVNEVFDIYIDRKSYHQTAVELSERYGKHFEDYWVTAIIKCRKYYDNVAYPPIITKDKYDKAAYIRAHNGEKTVQHTYRRFANRLIKCPCGRSYTAQVDVYCCSRHCKQGLSISIKWMDGLLWLIASHLESERLRNEDIHSELRQKQAVLASKIKSVDTSTRQAEKSRQRAKEMALRGYITIEELDARLARINSEVNETEKNLLRWREELAEIERLMKTKDKDIDRLLTIADNITLTDERRMRDIVRRWVTRIDLSGNSYHILVRIETLTRVYRAVYRPKTRPYKILTPNGGKLFIKPLERDGNIIRFGDLPANAELMVGTLAWLCGSEIV